MYLQEWCSEELVCDTHSVIAHSGSAKIFFFFLFKI